MKPPAPSAPHADSVNAIAATFIARWNGMAGSERSNYQLFIIELCELLNLERPQPASNEHAANAYVFERHLKAHDADASAANRFIDCYRRGSFVLEAKSVQTNRAARGAQLALRGAHAQAQAYARSLPVDEGRPPFIIVVDVGHVIELYSEFSRTGGAYLPFPDAGRHRIKITDLAKLEIRQRLRRLWLEPMALDPTRVSAKVTRGIAIDLAQLAQSLEADGHASLEVAGFLTRCLFTLFAEDVALLPKHEGKGSFTALLDSLAQAPAQAQPMLEELWQAMDTGGFSVALRAKLLRFNGKFFKNPRALPLSAAQLALLRRAAGVDWTQVEPAIFGTLLERALSPTERHSLGAHYTPRAYVERLVMPTVIAPLRAQWASVQAAALLLDFEGKHSEAQREVRTYHAQLCATRVLDPACGSGNFLYVTMEHMKRLEGEVLDLLQTLGASSSFDTQGLAVDPHQFLGIERNARAAAIAEMVLWIGYLQWHFRTHAASLPPEPVLRDFNNIECRDAVLTWAQRTPALDDNVQPISRWDGITYKTHPVTGEAVPDDSARSPVWHYHGAAAAAWPQADYIVGNPPFIGAARLRDSLGDGYTQALRAAWGKVPESTDFVMVWWHHAAQLVAAGQVKQFGFITTNSIKQTFNRKVVEQALKSGLELAYAVPDHPWVENTDGAAVRIAMTVGRRIGEGTSPALLQSVSAEHPSDAEGIEVTLNDTHGDIHADLSVGANLSAAHSLQSNENISERGFELGSAGFIVTHAENDGLLRQDTPALAKHPLINPYLNGRDLTENSRGMYLIDAFGLSEADLMRLYPAVYQRLLERVKPEREQNRDPKLRRDWWLHRRSRETLRKQFAGLPRYIATVETAKHRTFQFLDASVAPDNKLVCIASDSAYTLGVLSSAVHVAWAMAAGSTLEDRPVYVKTTCFETFPFPAATPEQTARIASLALQIDTHRKRQQAAQPDLTLTATYNVLEKLRSAQPLTDKDKIVHSQGLVSVLKTLHEQLDAAVLNAYGWADCASVQGEALNQTVLQRLIALNASRHAAEAEGTIVWLRPAYQDPKGFATQVQTGLDIEQAGQAKGELKGELKRGKAGKKLKTPQANGAQTIAPDWPTDLPQQMTAVAALLVAQPRGLSMAAIGKHFTGKGAWKKRLPLLVDTLVALGRARVEGDLVKN